MTIDIHSELDNFRCQLTCIHAHKDKNSQVLWCNDDFATATGMKHCNDLLGATDHDLIWQEFADDYRHHEQEALEGHIYSSIIPSKTCYSEVNLYIHEKIPQYDEDGNFKYLDCIAYEIYNPVLLNKKNPLLNFDYHTSPNYENSAKLNKREQECLYHFIYGKSVNRIATKMNVEKSTVESFLDNIKMKLNCGTRSNIIDTAIDLGYMQRVPTNMSMLNILSSLMGEN